MSDDAERHVNGYNLKPPCSGATKNPLAVVVYNDIQAKGNFVAELKFGVIDGEL